MSPLFFQILKQHKLSHLFNRTHAPQPPSPGLVLQLFSYFPVLSPSEFIQPGTISIGTLLSSQEDLQKEAFLPSPMVTTVLALKS
jgi:hypothetical protein